jgi:hypothetical protein
MSEESLLAIADDVENAPIEEAVEETPIEANEAPTQVNGDENFEYNLDFSGDDRLVEKDVDISQDKNFEKMVPLFKELNLTQTQARAMAKAYMDKTYELDNAEELLAGKYKTAEDLENGYKELTAKLREKVPTAPEEYSYDFSDVEALKDIIPEDFDFADDPLMLALEPVFKENNFTQEQMKAAVSTYLQHQSQLSDPQVELEKLGPNAKNLLQGAKEFSSLKHFTEEERSIIQNWATQADEVHLLNKINKLVSMNNNQKTIPTEGATTPVKSSVELYDEAKQIKSRPNFRYDSNAQSLYEKKLDAAIVAEEKGY